MSLPTTKIRDVTIRAITKTALSESPYSGVEQAYEYDYQKWALDINYPPLTQTQAQELIGYLLSLNGRANTFTFTLPDAAFPILGNAFANGLVNGGSQTGSSVESDGWPANMESLLKAGDYIGINGRLYMVTADVDSDASGEATISIWPNIRAINDNDEIKITERSSTFRLTSPNIEYNINIAKAYGVSISILESL